MRWDRPWEDRGRGVCPDSCQYLSHRNLTGAHTLSIHTAHSMKAHLNPIQATVSAAALHIFHNISINSTAPSLAPACCPALTRCLIVFPPCWIIFHTGTRTTTVSCRRQQNIRLHKHALAIWCLCEAARGVKLIFMQRVHHHCW